MVFLVSRPATATTLDIPRLAEIQSRGEAKFNPEQWYTATMAEMWCRPGFERVTTAGGEVLVKQAGLGSEAGGAEIHVLDLGAGMGQVTQTLMATSGLKGIKGVVVTAGDVDESALEVLNIKKDALGWGNVRVEKLNALVSPLERPGPYLQGDYLYLTAEARRPRCDLYSCVGKLLVLPASSANGGYHR
jgi:hypothetical protein